MEKPTCGDCAYWNHTYRSVETDAEFGECRRRSPKPFRYDPDYHVSDAVGYPETMFDEWCGEHSDFPAYIASLKTSPPSEVEAIELHLAGDGGALLVLRTALAAGLAIADFTEERLVKEIRNCGVMRARKIMTAIAAEKATDAIRKSAQPSCEASS